MRRSTIAKALSLSLIFFSLGLSVGQSQKKAVNMVSKAELFIKTHGLEKGLEIFQDTSSSFFEGELYIFAYDFSGVCLANGQKPKLVGQNRLDVEDVNGIKYVQKMIELSKTKGEGWVNYQFINPTTKQVEPKRTYFKRVQGKNAFIACGIYDK